MNQPTEAALEDQRAKRSLWKDRGDRFIILLCAVALCSILFSVNHIYGWMAVITASVGLSIYIVLEFKRKYKASITEAVMLTTALVLFFVVVAVMLFLAIDFSLAYTS